jgi:hypothetical protein
VNALWAFVVVLALLATLAGTLLVFPAMWVAVRGQWRRLPADARRRGLVTSVVTTLGLVVAMALVIAAPWGRYSVLYVIGFGGGALMTAAIAGVAVQAVRDVRRAKRRRRRP